MDLDKKPTFKKAYSQILEFCGEDTYLVSHNNICFDKRFLLIEMARAGFKRPSNWKFIDTLRIARLVYPEMKSHRQDMLRQLHKLSTDGSHRANKDVKDLVVIYQHMTKGKSVEEIYTMTQTLYKRMPFGKHKNKKLKDVPIDYVEWIIKKSYDKVLINSFRKILNKSQK